MHVCVCVSKQDRSRVPLLNFQLCSTHSSENVMFSDDVIVMSYSR